MVRRRLIILTLLMAVAGCGEQLHKEQLSGSANNSSATPLRLPPDPFGWPILDRDNKQVGIVTTRLGRQGVIIALDTSGLPPGVHGVHIHEFAKCDPPTFKSAGAHWNWSNKVHGHKNLAGYHAGDLGNLVVGADGKARTQFVVAARDWDPKAAGGRSLIIHTHADDDKTDPSGGSGQRLACGIFFLRRD